MNTAQHISPRFATALPRVLAALVATSALLLAAGEAQARQRSTTVTGANGQTAQRSVTRAGGDVSSSTTGPNGRSTSRTVDRSASGATATVTGPNGNTASRVTTRSGTGSQTTATGPSGQTRSVTVTHP